MLYCLDSMGRLKWSESAAVTGVGMLGGRVVTLEEPGVLTRDSQTGMTQARTALPIDVIEAKRVIKFRDELIFLAAVSGSGIPPYRVPIRVRLEPDGDLTASVLEAYRGVAVVDSNLVGLRHESGQKRLVVEVIEE
jgi:hypothetical protein